MTFKKKKLTKKKKHLEQYVDCVRQVSGETSNKEYVRARANYTSAYFVQSVHISS